MSNQNKLFETIASVFNTDLDSISEASSPDTVTGWDSMGMVHLVVELEKVFNVQFDIMEIADFHSVEIIKTVLIEKGVVFDQIPS
jgi:acyl carrier protein